METNHSPRLSLCLIARDSARTLPACLESIRPWVDEIVVVDTGSTDDTVAIARSFNARVFAFPWCDDFSTARNASIGHAQGTWLFWMDSDDTIDEANGSRLRELAYSQHRPNILGYVMQVHCPGPHLLGEDDCTVVDHVKLVRNLPNLRFEGRIHEQVLPAIRRLGGDIEWTSLHVVHSGSDQSLAGRKRKQDRDLRILRLDLTERPNHPFVLFNLGMTYADMDEHATAIDYLRRSIAVSMPGESHLRKAYALLVSSLAQNAQTKEALAACLEGQKLFPEDPELIFRLAVLAQQEKRLQEAREGYVRLLRYQGQRHFSSIDPGILGFKARYNLAAVLQEMGQTDRAEIQWRQILAEMPSYQLAWQGLVECLLRRGRYQTAAIEIEQILNSKDLRCTALLMRARISEARGNLEMAKADINLAVHDYPEQLDALHSLCRFLFDHGELLEAKLALETLRTLLPTDPSVLHNLGTINVRLGQHAAAVEFYEESLRLRPESGTTLRELEAALRASGNSEAAESAVCRAEALRAYPSTEQTVSGTADAI
jgi:O-antigen biosynthesis protein